MNTFITVVIVVVVLLLIGLIIFALVNGKKDANELSQENLKGGNVSEKTVIGENARMTYILVDDFSEKDNLINSIVENGFNYMTVDTSSNESVRSRVKKEIINVVWLENSYTIIGDNYQSIIEIARELRNAGNCVSQLIIFGKPLMEIAEDFPISVIERVEEIPPNSIRRVYGERGIPDLLQIGEDVKAFDLLGVWEKISISFKDSDPISSAFKKIAISSEIEKYYDRINAAFNDFASRNGILIYSNTINFVGSGSYNVVFTFDEIGVNVLRINFNSQGFRDELISEAYELLKGENTGFARVIDYNLNDDFEWALIERLYPVEIPIDEGKMEIMCDNLSNFFSKSPKYFSFIDFASRNIMKNGAGEYVIADIDLLLVGGDDCVISKDTTSPFEDLLDSFIPLSSANLLLNLIRAITKANSPQKKHIEPSEISLMAIKLFKLSKFRIGLYVSNDLKTKFKK